MSNTKEYEIKKSEIIDCAEKLFTSRGYEVTTVNAILKEVGIAKGTFYYYFDSKEEVMDAVIMRFVNEDLDLAKKILSQNNISALEKLILSIFTKPKSIDKKIMIEQLYKTNNALMKQRTLQRTIDIICPVYAEMITEGNKNNEFSSVHPLADIQFLVAGIQTMYDLSNVKDSSVGIDIEVVVNTIFCILKIDEAKTTKAQVLKMINENMDEI